MADPITGALADMFPDIVEVRRRTGTDEAGDPTFNPIPELLPCRVANGQGRTARLPDGREVSLVAKVTFDGIFNLTVDEDYTLPADFDPRNQEPIYASPVRDENGPHHDIVMF